MKQIITTYNKPIKAYVTIPGSKSITNRALLLASLADGVSEISNILLSDDTKVFLSALRQLGVPFTVDEKKLTCTIEGGAGIFPKKEASVWCGDAGTAARFLLAVCASMEGIYHFDGSPQLRTRPLGPLVTALHLQGAKFYPSESSHLPLDVRGIDGLIGKEIRVDASSSGQFISAMLMAAPLAKNLMIIDGENLGSYPYVEMTCVMMSEFGVQVRKLHATRFAVPVPQTYRPCNYVVEPDMSTASYFFAAAAVSKGEVKIPLFIEKSKQGDVKFISILKKMGCSVIINAEGVTVIGPETLHGVSIDMRDCSDTFMTIAAIAAFADSPTTITNIAHTRLQESNRITVMREQLNKLNIKAEEGKDWLRIFPSTPVGSDVSPHNDHRIAMSLALIGLRTEGVVIENPGCVAKTCPDYFKMLEQLIQSA